MSNPARQPCGSCPYRQDVPSGVWAPDEYEKLPAYDNETPAQPLAAFFCHQQDGRLCAGWVGCHDMQESLGLRMAQAAGTISSDVASSALDYESPVPLFESGAAAAAHGLAEIAMPREAAIRTQERIKRKRTRRRSP